MLATRYRCERCGLEQQIEICEGDPPVIPPGALLAICGDGGPNGCKTIQPMIHLGGAKT